MPDALVRGIAGWEPVRLDVGPTLPRMVVDRATNTVTAADTTPVVALEKWFQITVPTVVRLTWSWPGIFGTNPGDVVTIAGLIDGQGVSLVYQRVDVGAATVHNGGSASAVWNLPAGPYWARVRIARAAGSGSVGMYGSADAKPLLMIEPFE